MTCTVFLAGSGGGFPDINQLRAAPDDKSRFETIDYPGWRRYARAKFRPEQLVSELAAEVERRAPSGPIRIVGISMGGHFGYLIARNLQERGRDVQGLCAIDSFTVTTDAPTHGWVGRAFGEFLNTIGHHGLLDLLRWCRSRFWRAVLRALGNRLPALLAKACESDRAARLLEIDPILKIELDVRMMARGCAAWLAGIDQHPVALLVPTALLRIRDHAESDATWRARCPNLVVHEIEGSHATLFESENFETLRAAYTQATRDWGHSTSNA